MFVSFSRSSLTFFALLLTALASCSTPGANPDDMSAQEHRRAAADHAARSDDHGGEFDPSASPREVQAVNGSTAGDFEYGLGSYNPTSQHAAESAAHRRHAADHLAAARELESFEDAQCASFPPSTRGVCPLLGQVVSVEPIEGGARAVLAEGANVEAIVAHIQCHLAYARTQGHEGMDACPLYLPGVQSARTGAQTIELTTEDPSLVDELRHRLADHVAP